MRLFKFFTVFLLLISFVVYGADIKIQDINYKRISNNKIELKINLSEDYDVLPTLTLKKNIIQLAMPETKVWPTIKKKVTLGSKKATIMAYQYNKNLSRIRFLLPTNALYLKNKIKINVLNKSISLIIPYSTKKKVLTKTGNKVSNKDALKYDESYLNQLLNSSTTKKLKVESKPISNNKNDFVSFKNAGIKKITKPKFSVMKYVGKFVAFLALILLGFYGIVMALKKGALSKTKLGFLNSTKIVEVLSNTYVGPKKNLMLVRAHNQVFLVGNTDQGLQLISEVKDTAGIIKSGEKQISGSNFDTNVDHANIASKDFKLKEVLDKSTPVDLSSNKTSRFKEQLKEKVRNLKSMQ